MNYKKAMLSIAIVVFTQFLLASYIYADPAPEISSFEILSIGIEDTTGSLQWTDTPPYTYNVAVNAGSTLYFRTLQYGYAASQVATCNGNTVYSFQTELIHDPYPIVVGFIDYWDCGVITQPGTFVATVRSINTYQAWNAGMIIHINPVLTVTTLGTGSGSVTADTGALSWNGNTGTAIYAVNTLVTLTPTASAGTSFDGWSGACTNTSGDCVITMDSDKSVSSTFSVIPNTMVDSTPYGTLNNAYNAVPADGIIKAREMIFVEDLTLNRDISFTLEGGYSDDFSTRPGLTTLDGVLTIANGSMVIDGLIIQFEFSSESTTPPDDLIDFIEDPVLWDTENDVNFLL